jgi:hypothetical protein
MFDLMYIPYSHERAAFGDHWKDPPRYEYGKPVLCAEYPKVGGDGQAVEVHCTAMPARFYEVRAFPSLDSTGKFIDGFILNTGSDESVLAATIAKAISEGMLGCKAWKPS